LPRRTLAVIAGLYLIQGFPPALHLDVWPVYLRQSGVDLATLGQVSALSAAWAFKFLWSPLVDRFGERQHWVASALLVIALALLALAQLDAAVSPRAVYVAIAVVCFASATQDIAIDAYSIGLVRPGEEGPANATRVAAYRVALLLFGGGVLFLPEHVGWDGTHEALALAALGLALFALVVPPRIPIPAAERRDVLGAFRGWRGRGALPAVLGFVLLFRLADLAMGPMVAPFWVDGGIPLREIAFVKSGIGFGATVAGAALGGFLVRRLGIGRGLWVAGVLAMLSNLGYAAAALAGGGRLAIFSASIAESLCSGVAAVGFMSFLMRICDRAHAAVQYAVLSGFALVTGSLARAFSGVAAEQLGYAGFFAATALLALPAFALLPAAARWAHEDEASAATRRAP
jgi:MFS transporter, PAT family, beta-lactamase induction signal transducer AmpG